MLKGIISMIACTTDINNPIFSNQEFADRLRNLSKTASVLAMVASVCRIGLTKKTVAKIACLEKNTNVE